MMARLLPLPQEEDALGSAFPVAQPVFSGPLHLLLSLIESRALDISEVSLIAVTSDYLNAVKDIQDLPAQSACTFIDVTSRLIALKARYLFPDFATDYEDDEPGESLVDQLEQLKAYGYVVEELYLRQHDGTRTYRRHVVLPITSVQGNGVFESSSRLAGSLQNLLKSLPRIKPATWIQKPLYTVEDLISRIQGTIRTWKEVPSSQQLSFFSLLRPSSSRSEIVLTFLALLELIRTRELRAIQEAPFADITILPRPTDGNHDRS